MSSLKILFSLQVFLFETCKIKISKVTNNHFWTILVLIGFFFIFDPLKKCFPAKFIVKKFPWISWTNWLVLNQKLIWNIKKNRDPKKAIYEFTCFIMRFWNLQFLKLPFCIKIQHNFVIKRYQWLQETQEIFWGKSCGK